MSRGLAIETVYYDDEYTFTYLGATVTMSRLRAKSDTITAEMSVHWTIPPYDGLVHGPANTNLLADRTLTSIVTHCRTQLDQLPDDFPWWKFLNQSKSMAIKRFRQGNPLVPLEEVSTVGRIRHLIPHIVESDGATVMAAPGGSVKSFFALAAAAAVVTGRAGFLGGIDPTRTGPVVYLDWESNAETHRERLDALCRPLNEPVPRIMYRREYLPLTQSAKELATEIQREGAVMVVIDSKGAASATPGDRDGTIEFFNAVRSFGCGTLIIDHMSKRASYGKDFLSAYGSVYTENLARVMWVAPRAVSTEDGVAVLWKLQKVNNGRSGRLMALRVAFGEDEEERETVRISQIPYDSPLFDPPTEGDSWREKVVSFLRNSAGAVPALHITDRLGAKPNTINKVLRELEEDGVALKTGSGRYIRWYAVPVAAPITTEEADDLPEPW